MKRQYTKWIVAGIALTTVSVLAGCGAATTSPSANIVTNNTTNTTSTMNAAGATNTANNATKNTSTEPSNSSSSTTNNTTGTNQTPAKVYVFSQSILKAMYVAKKDSSVGPIEPPNDIVQGTKVWASKVSLAMLNFVPEQDRALDKQLIDEIRNPQEPPLKDLPGYTLKSYQTPTGGGSYWWPTNNIWPKWVDPVQQ